MARAKAGYQLSKQQVLFRMDSIYPLDANNLDVEEAISRLFIYLRTGGRPIMRTDKPVFIADDANAETPAAVVEAVFDDNPTHFSGVSNTARKDLITAWLESHYALMSRRGKKKGGQYRMSGLKPLHFMVIKLFNPQPRRQDRRLSDFFYNALKDDPVLTTSADSLFKQFFGVASQRFGDNDYRIDEDKLKSLAQDGKLDIELLFLLRLLEPFDADQQSTQKKDQVSAFTFLCPEQIELMQQDLRLLFLYKSHIPRRELINYMITLMVFHAALYFHQIVCMTNDLVKNGKIAPPRGIRPVVGEHRSHTPFQVQFFCDLTNGHSADVDALAKRSYVEQFKEIERYFKSAYLMKKVEQFAEGYLTREQKETSGREYIKILLGGFLRHKDLDGFFARDIQEIIENSKDEETDEVDPDLQRVLDIANQRKLTRLETFVEILYQRQYQTLREQHRKLIADLCGSEQDRGFMSGRGRTYRKYVIGNELLEVLIQLAVLRQSDVDGRWHSEPIEIRSFVDWLAGRYGLLIDQLPGDWPEDEKTNRALAANYEALKTRLRQLGFFTDLSDASNSQVIEPRFAIRGEELKTGDSAA